MEYRKIGSFFTSSRSLACFMLVFRIDLRGFVDMDSNRGQTLDKLGCHFNYDSEIRKKNSKGEKLGCPELLLKAILVVFSISAASIIINTFMPIRLDISVLAFCSKCGIFRVQSELDNNADYRRGKFLSYQCCRTYPITPISLPATFSYSL